MGIEPKHALVLMNAHLQAGHPLDAYFGEFLDFFDKFWATNIPGLTSTQVPELMKLLVLQEKMHGYLSVEKVFGKLLPKIMSDFADQRQLTVN